jgi:hypothetical protein
MNLRIDAYHSQDAIGEMQHLASITADNKEEFEYTIMYLSRRLTNISMQIRSKRESLLAFIQKHNIDQTAYQVVGRILSDDVYPDTVADQNLGTVEIEKALRKNIPDELFALLKNQIQITIDWEINDRIDELKKMKLMKAQLEFDLLTAQQALDSYLQNDDLA